MRPLRAEPLHPALAYLLLGWSLLMLLAPELPVPVRAAVVLPYLLLAPGYATLPFLGGEHLLLHGLLSLSASIAIATGLATAMSETGWWRTELATTATSVAVVAVVLCRLWRRRVLAAAVTGGDAWKR